MPPEFIKHYQIKECVGQGSYGDVYKALDTKLKRTIALKILHKSLCNSPDRLKQFIREAQIISSLDHPNLCVVYDLDLFNGQQFYSMPFYGGVTLQKAILRKPFSIDEFCSVSKQLLEGLMAAHEGNVIHGDLKPANILLLDNGQVKIIDFGVAALCDQPEDKESGGTVAYMAPECFQGQKPDKSSDIWSLGVVYYEMLTGRRPFASYSSEALAYAVSNEPPEGLHRADIPQWLERIILKMLAKDTKKRYQHCDEVLQAMQAGLDTDAQHPGKRTMQLWSWIAVAVPLLSLSTLGIIHVVRDARQEIRQNIRRIAVLPLEDVSEQPSPSFSAGMTDLLIGELAQIKALDVISRTSTRQYAETDKTVKEIAKELNVDTIVEGTVFKADGQVRINIQLIDAQKDIHLWVRSYQRAYEDIFAIQKEITGQVAEAIEIRVERDESDRLKIQQSVDPRALDYYVLAKDFWAQTEVDSAKIYLMKSVEISPHFLEAYLTLAAMMGDYHFYTHCSQHESAPLAREAALKALELDPHSGRAYASLAWIKAVYEYDFREADRLFQKAVRLQPGNNRVHAKYGWFLSWVERTDEAAAELTRAVELDPLRATSWANLAEVLRIGGRLEEALPVGRKARFVNPAGRVARMRLSTVFYTVGELDSALAESQILKELSNNTPMARYLEVLILVTMNRSVEGMTLLRHIEEDVAPRGLHNYSAAKIAIAMGEYEKAITYMERGYAANEGDVVLYKAEPLFKKLSGHSRYEALLKRIGFPE